ncbi:MAG TPA: rod shape-determining protein MreC [Bacteroidales bacterium]|nr:rod shape-determining protein MreC [Bacteroidales bacterium]
MRNLLNFIVRYYFFILFLLLQTVAILLLAQNHHYQRFFLVSSANFFAGQFYTLTSGVSRYFNLGRINQQLALQNQQLMQITSNSFLKTDTHLFVYQDTVMNRKFQYINAEVINNSINRRDNFLTINKGRRHGIEPHMGVITLDGVVGIVAHTTERFSSVISLLHKDSNVSVRVKKNDHVGSLTWEGFNYRKATLNYIPTHVELAYGDTIVTSGYSVIFPEGIFIGTIQDFEVRPGDNFITAEIKLALDFNNLRYVMVVKNLMLDELKELQALTEVMP